jgi:hypothetical protein
MYLAGAVSGGMGVLVTYLPTFPAALVGIFVLLAVLAAVAWLEKAPYERQQSRKDPAII